MIDWSLFFMCLITAFVFFFAIIYCILSTCMGVNVRRHFSELDFSWRGILDAVAFNAPQAREQRRRAALGLGPAAGGAMRGGRRGETNREESYEMMGWNRAAQQGRRGM